MQLDNIDFKILRLLNENSRMQWKDLGEEIHMTGQAVGNRIKKLEDGGVIKAYSVIIDEIQMGYEYTAFVIVFMESKDNHSFINFINQQKEIIEAHRVSGEGCYHLKIKVESQSTLNKLLDNVLEYGNYKLYLSINEVKHRSLLNDESE